PSSRVMHLGGQTTGVKVNVRRIPSYVLDARRRYLLKNHSAFYAALIDSGMIVGLMLNRLYLAFTGGRTPPHRIEDAIKHSVFLKGFRVTAVQNPALAEHQI